MPQAPYIANLITRAKIFLNKKHKNMHKGYLLVAISFLCLAAHSQTGSNHGNKFEQLGTTLPTPNEYRTASGAPGPKYWQQRCDYDIKCNLDEEN